MSIQSAFAPSLLMVACVNSAGVVYTPVNTPVRGLVQRPLEAVEVYLGAPPTRAHEEVGVFEISSNASNPTKAAFETLRLHGALRGCDALQLLELRGPDRYTTQTITAVCDIYTDEAARKAAAERPPAKPLPGQGAFCTATDTGDTTWGCADPWVCRQERCVSPYQ